MQERFPPDWAAAESVAHTMPTEMPKDLSLSLLYRAAELQKPQRARPPHSIRPPLMFSRDIHPFAVMQA